MNIFHIAPSPRGESSVSRKLADRFIAAVTDMHADTQVYTLDVWKVDLLPFDGAALEAKYADLTGVTMTSAQAAVWRQIGDLGGRFQDADVILISLPFWNFGIPYRLRHLIDVVSQRGVLFDFDEYSLRDLLSGRTAVICAARGLALGPDYPEQDFDHQVAYLRTWARMVGITDVQVAMAQAQLGGPKASEADFQAGFAQASAIARELAK